MVLSLSCPVCGAPGFAVCPRCWASFTPAEERSQVEGVDLTLSIFAYNPELAKVIVAAKNRGRRDLLDWLAARMIEGIRGRAADVGPIEGVTWIPAARHHRRRRGFDQGKLLADRIGAELGVGSAPYLLRRRGGAQENQPRSRRLAGPDLRCPRSVRGPILLIDDVITTGTSLRHGANALRRSGAGRVVALGAASSQASRR